MDSRALRSGRVVAAERISVLVAPDGKFYAYCYARLLSDLFVGEGLK